MPGKLQDIDRSQQKVTHGRQYKHHQKDKGKYQYQPYEPYLVAVVGNAEKYFQDACIQIILDAKGHGIKNEQYPGHDLQAVDKAIIDLIAIHHIYNGDKKIEGQGGQYKPDKAVTKDNLHVVFHHFTEKDP